MTKQYMILAGAVVMAASLALAQPSVDSVTNAASQLTAAFPGGGVAQGARFLVAGKNLGPSDPATGTVPYATNLVGVSVQVTVGESAVDAFIVSASAAQVVGILPSSTLVGAGNLKITFNDQSATAPIKVVATAVGLYTRSQAGSGPAAALNVAGDGGTSPNSLTNSAQPGQSVQLPATGLGAISGDDADVPPAGDLAADIEVIVGSKRVAPVTKGRSGDPGNDLITVSLPADVETGCYVPVAVKSGQTVSNFSSISVAPNGGNCSDAAGLSSADLDKAVSGGSLSLGVVSLSRSRTKFSFPGGGSIPGLGENLEIKMDSGAASFFRFDTNALQSASRSVGGQAPVGSCLVYTYQGSSPQEAVLPAVLDAGPVINVTGPKGAKQLKKNQTGSYDAQLGGGSIPISLPFPVPGLPQGQPDFLEAGSYTIDNGSGGADVGAFSAKLSIASPLVWQNQDSITNVPRTQDLLITWTGGGAGQIVEIMGTSAITNPIAGASFVCLARVEAGRFSVPSAVLLALPQSAVAQGVSTGMLMVGSVSPNPNRFTASGLDVGTVSVTDLSSKNVNYQ